MTDSADISGLALLESADASGAASSDPSKLRRVSITNSPKCYAASEDACRRSFADAFWPVSTIEHEATTYLAAPRNTGRRQRTTRTEAGRRWLSESSCRTQAIV